MIFVPSESNKRIVEIWLERELEVLHFLELRLVVLGFSLSVNFVGSLDWLGWLRLYLGVLFNHSKYEQSLLRFNEYGLYLCGYFRLDQLTFLYFFFQKLHFLLETINCRLHAFSAGILELSKRVKELLSLIDFHL